MTEKDPFEHEAVMSSLTDLQRRLREAGEDEEAGEDAAPTIVRAVAQPREDTVAVTERDLTVVMTQAPEGERPERERRERFAPVAQLPPPSASVSHTSRMSCPACWGRSTRCAARWPPR